MSYEQDNINDIENSKEMENNYSLEDVEQLEDNKEVEFDDDLCIEADKQGEIYTIDINTETDVFVCGGAAEYVEVRSCVDDILITRVEDLTESVVYTKFISNNRILFVTINGIVGCLDENKEVSLFTIDEEITTAKFTELLIIGTQSGQVYLYDEELEHINTYGGHPSEVLSVDYQEGRVLSLSASGLLVHDKHGRCLYSLKGNEATCFRYIASDVICYAADKKIRMFKENKKLFELKTEEDIEVIELVEKSLVLGGYSEYILLVDTTGHFATFKLPIQGSATMIKRYKGYEIVFATNSDYIGVLDIRDIKTLRYYPTCLETIFDIAVSGDKVAVAGVNGFLIIDLLTAEPESSIMEKNE